MKVTFQMTITDLTAPDQELAQKQIADFINDGMIGIKPENIMIIKMEPEHEWEKNDY
jgi:hypothetical protein